VYRDAETHTARIGRNRRDEGPPVPNRGTLIKLTRISSSIQAVARGDASRNMTTFPDGTRHLRRLRRLRRSGRAGSVTNTSQGRSNRPTGALVAPAATEPTARSPAPRAREHEPLQPVRQTAAVQAAQAVRDRERVAMARGVRAPPGPTYVEGGDARRRLTCSATVSPIESSIPSPLERPASVFENARRLHQLLRPGEEVLYVALHRVAEPLQRRCRRVRGALLDPP
jgi:hypothetical protein